MQVELIAACDRQGVIGLVDGGVPWDLPRDRAHFRRHASGSCMLLGRRTYEEMHGWFSNHLPLVLTRDTDYQPARPGTPVASLTAALAAAKSIGAPRLLVAGGAAVFAAALPLADRLMVTHVDVDWQQHQPQTESKQPAGEPPRFPFIDPAQWRIIRRQHHPADTENPWPLDFCWYQRQAATAST